MPLFLIKRKSILKFIGSFQLTVESFSSRSTRVELRSSSSSGSYLNAVLLNNRTQAVLSLFKDLGKAWYRRPKGLAYAKFQLFDGSGDLRFELCISLVLNLSVGTLSEIPSFPPGGLLAYWPLWSNSPPLLFPSYCSPSTLLPYPVLSYPYSQERPACYLEY
ncbi:hypothetical protein NE237_016298 [Protea cynaroides]|uniref:Uncharacterized protein n=1 Tax=Protea cynaroides TaxID=273540 RepID=A0A9Q0GL87_9MAGN|nr:hypothetical protein NE237_016298 [Protea cynaroides]